MKELKGNTSMTNFLFYFIMHIIVPIIVVTVFLFDFFYLRHRSRCIYRRLYDICENKKMVMLAYKAQQKMELKSALCRSVLISIVTFVSVHYISKYSVSRPVFLDKEAPYTRVVTKEY